MDNTISKNNKQKTSMIQKLSSFIGLAALVIILSILSPNFFTVSNLFNVIRQVSINGLIAFGMTFVILTGGIDLSVGSIVALSGALTAGMMVSGMSTGVAVLIGLLLGLCMGIINGVIISIGKVAPFIATLATMTVYRGAALLYTDGVPITGLNENFAKLGKGYFLKVFPMPMVLLLIAFLISYITLKKTTFGRYVYALGGNEQTTFFSGINTTRIKITVYAISGLLAALGGIVLTSRLNSAQPTAGLGFESDAIAAVVVGGTSLTGGKGWIVGTLIGAMIIGILTNGLNLLNVQSYYQQILKGLVILAAVILDRSESK